ncbi:hypothetical protein [Photorhabdus laumondii]|uniref:hypothetical protein n=1 Tax=Photorhabdus laumondii TaxID=2218628 RepID=UPI0025B21457|nr:hypothetical protein [Photorhabdus laumondii]
MKDEFNLPCECGGTAVLCWSRWSDNYSYSHACCRCLRESKSYKTAEESAAAWSQKAGNASVSVR